MKPNIVQHLLFGILIIVAQITVFNHLRILGATPDVVLVYIIWIMRHHDRTKSLLLAAFLGLFQDALLDLWGLNMFAKSALVMFAYTSIPKTDESRPPVFKMSLLLLFLVFLHNLILIGLSVFIQSLSTWHHVYIILLGNTVFTALTALFVYIFSSDSV
jgi:rod shape-determining protein MreD